MTGVQTCALPISHFGQKPKLGEYVSLTDISLFRSLNYYMSVCLSFLCTFISFLFAFLLFFSFCSVAFVALFVYYLKTQKDFSLFFAFLSYNKKDQKYFLLFLVRSFSLSLQVASFQNRKQQKDFSFSFCISSLFTI